MAAWTLRVLALTSLTQLTGAGPTTRSRSCAGAGVGGVVSRGQIVARHHVVTGTAPVTLARRPREDVR